MDDEVFAAREIRKKLWWMMPFSAGMVFLAWYSMACGIVPSIEALYQYAPSVRIGPAALVGPFIGAAFAVILVLGPLRAIPYTGIWSKRLEWLMNGFIASSCVALILVVLGSTPLQNHYMPKLGYTRCDLLEGNPTLWFTDWVKNPEWCVRGKSRAWVHEQAGVQPPKY